MQKPATLRAFLYPLFMAGRKTCPALSPLEPTDERSEERVARRGDGQESNDPLPVMALTGLGTGLFGNVTGRSANAWLALESSDQGDASAWLTVACFFFTPEIR
ncbi:hypothetical protein C5B76_12795 [Aeromonas salmonicida]|nr:hypothetical protein C5B76_12795 [Aeromonas salmonicida]